MKGDAEMAAGFGAALAITEAIVDEMCAHNVIQTWRPDDGIPQMWACAECRLRFYPADAAPPQAQGAIEPARDEALRLEGMEEAAKIFEALPITGQEFDARVGISGAVNVARRFLTTAIRAEISRRAKQETKR